MTKPRITPPGAKEEAAEFYRTWGPDAFPDGPPRSGYWTGHGRCARCGMPVNSAYTEPYEADEWATTLLPCGHTITRKAPTAEV